MPQIELSAGTIEYTDTSGGGPVIVLLHGLLMDATLWDEVTAAHAAVVHWQEVTTICGRGVFACRSQASSGP